MEDFNLIHGDCLVEMPKLIEGGVRVDMILCDLPYGQTARNKWDTIIPFDILWNNYSNIIQKGAVVVLFANGMFTSDLMTSNRGEWRYNLIWDKVLASGHLNANKMPMRVHEDICVFYQTQPTYHPQKTEGKASHSVGKAEGVLQEEHSRNTNYGQFKKVQTDGNMKHPKSILRYQKPHPSKAVHPTEKPVDLLVNLIRTYTNIGDMVLDNTMGSCSTGVACKITRRKFIGIEKEQKYYDVAVKRMEQEHQTEMF